MSCGKCGKSMPLCPFSFGLALGLTCAIAVLIWSVWVMKFGMPTMMVSHMIPPATFADVAKLAGWCLLKGFLFGLVFALLYDFISCCCKARCCKKPDGSTGCSCGCVGCTGCSCGTKPKVQ